MNTRTLFERITRFAVMDTPSFLDYYNDSVLWLLSQYGEKYVLEKGARYRAAEVLDDPSPVRDAYTPAIMDHILYLASGDANRYALSQQAAESAYKTVWREKSYGKVLNVRATNDPHSCRDIRVGKEDRDV